MELKVLGSSSSGNCYLLENEKEALILECGVSFNHVIKALDFNLKKVVGCLVTHEHKDHCKGVNQVLKTAIPVLASAGTIEAMNAKSIHAPRAVKAGEVYTLGGFRIMPFDVKHDSAEPLGYFLQHEETGNVLFATDTYYLPKKFSKLSNIIIECNYSLDILEENINKKLVHPLVRCRTIESHMSFTTCLEALLANDLTAVNNIVLVHLSDTNSNAKQFKEAIYKATGKTVHIAEKGLNIKFNKTPF